MSAVVASSAGASIIDSVVALSMWYSLAQDNSNATDSLSQKLHHRSDNPPVELPQTRAVERS